MTDVLLEAQGLVAGRGGFRLPPVDLHLHAGAALALTGANGAGKTTLLRTLAGLLPPLSGRLTPGPGGVAYLAPPGVVTSGLTALEVVALGRVAGRGWFGGPRPADLQTAREALADLGQADLADRPLDRLSSGQAQLVLFAQARLNSARVLLLDEPTALLDAGHADRVRAALRAFRDEGRAVIVASHDPALIRDQMQVWTVSVTTIAPVRGHLEATAAPAACPLCGRSGDPAP